MKGTVLITGASSGIGEAFARKFAREEFDLVLVARGIDRLANLKETIKGVNVTLVTADLATDTGVDHLLTEIREAGLTIDILVNNAAALTPGPLEELAVEDIKGSISLNMTAVTRLIHHFLPDMLDRRSGRILNVASVAAFHPVPGMHLYAATKSFVLSLSESLSENLKGSGVSVTALCPGLTDTGGLDEQIAARVPPQLIATPESVADEGFEALMLREAVRVPGQFNKLGVTLAQHQPRWLVRSLGGIVAKLSRP